MKIEWVERDEDDLICPFCRWVLANTTPKIIDLRLKEYNLKIDEGKITV